MAPDTNPRRGPSDGAPDLRADGRMAMVSEERAPRRGKAKAAADAPPRPPKPPRRRPLFGRLIRLGFVASIVLMVAGAIGTYGIYRSIEADLPDHSWLAEYEPPQMSRIFAADSRLMAELAQERRVFVPLDAIPAHVQNAFISAEDQNFRTHVGVDPVAILRAAVQNLRDLATGRRPVGASTITQQVAKNMLVGADVSVLRKIREAILAIRLEQAMSKDRILEIYLNEIFLGAQAYGVAAAAQTYFNRDLSELTIAEAAYLAALPKGPANYHPLRQREAAIARRNWVIGRMLADGHITAEQAAEARAAPLTARIFRRPDMVAVGGHYTEEVRRELIARFGQEATTMGGLVVRTAMDPALQEAAERSLREGLMAYDRRRGGWRGPVAQNIAHGEAEWRAALAAQPRVPGTLPEWRLAVVREVAERQARVSFLERAADGTLTPRTLPLLIEDHAWARPVREGGVLGPAPRRLQDILSPGDVVLVEPLAATPAQGRTVAARPERAVLRQVPEVEGAVVAMEPRSGRVLAMAGGWSLDRSWFNRATQAQRQPGSSFKPFVYFPALELGIPPNQLLLDDVVEIRQPGQAVWRPGNYSGQPQGWVTMRTAMERSLNLVTVRLAQEIGMDRVVDTARRFGVIDNMPPFLAMALGAGETTVIRQAAAYATFVNGGFRVTPTLIDSVQDRRGRVIFRGDTRRCDACGSGPEAGPPALADQRQRVADPIAAYQMVSLLQGAVQRGTGGRAGAGLTRPVAGKTGTTDDYRDNWFVGFTPELVVAVWVGYDEPRSLGTGETGGTNAAPIFNSVVRAALRDTPAVPFRAPPGLSYRRITLPNGQTMLEAFRPGTEDAARPPSDPFAGGEGAQRLDSGLGGLY
jgi:penicillin-binding protein 1A